MNSDERSPSPALSRGSLVQAFAIGYVVWFVPVFVRWAFASLSTRMVAYQGLWIALLYVLALGTIWIVYRAARARGLSLKVASALSLAATVPAMMISYLVDLQVGRWDASLSLLRPEEPRTLTYALATALFDSVAIATFLAAIVFLPVFARAHEERNHELERVSREAELLRFRAHLEPHFVLNSLNAVAGLVEDDPPQARELLAALGDLFREASAFHVLHRVEDEIEWLKRYVTIHELRHPDVLRASWEVDPDTLALTCPALILQPLVENAVKHGALRGGGHLLVRAALDGGTLTLTVEDDGPELGAPRAGGRGLTIVKRRLQLESERESGFELVREGARTVARVRLPASLRCAHA
ncbi:MAG: histidine kinase [Labilithrix sp.]|nr:histidine kinase [Labilithrix sp.]